MAARYAIPNLSDSGAFRMLRVFLCHCSEDKDAVRGLHKRLATDGFDPWLDEAKLVPGQDFDREIRNAVRASDVVLACLSKHSITKEGYVQREIRFALDAAQEKPEGTIYIIPLRLQECRVPDQLGRLHWVNLYTRNGYQLLLEALLARASELERLQNIVLLREMLVANNAQPAYVVASPKYPNRNSRKNKKPRQAYDHRTFGDNLGVRGLIHAFGALLGVEEVELISAQHAPPNLARRPLNLYLIGSPKVNPSTRPLLRRTQRDCTPQWTFGPLPGKKERGNWDVVLYLRKDGKTTRFADNHGLLVRAPHPHHPDRVILIAAGPRSIGTGAACLAATRPTLIKKISAMLPAGVLGDKRRKFWALVQGTIIHKGRLLEEDGVHIVEAGVYDENRPRLQKSRSTTTMTDRSRRRA